jgi:methionyl-tRNA formyltransferase
MRLYCGYRDWALKAYDELKKYNFDLCTSQEQLEKLDLRKYEFVLLAGWSWIIPDELLKKAKIYGVHPSDLPDYRGGSPLQNQIIDGITRTKCSLFEIAPGIDKGGILAKVPISLEGSMSDIFNELTRCTIELGTQLAKTYPKITITKQGEGKTLKRRKPNESKLEPELFKKDLLKAYNIIRALGDPYPNAYIEDGKGNKLFFKEVKYVKGEDHV